MICGIALFPPDAISLNLLDKLLVIEKIVFKHKKGVIIEKIDQSQISWF